MRLRILAVLVAVFLVAASCSSQTEQKSDSAAKPAEKTQKDQSKKGLAALEGAKMQAVDPETGEVLGDVTMEVLSVEERDRRMFYPAKAEAAASLKDVYLMDDHLKKVDVNLKGKLTLIEYWSEDGLASGKYWNRMRELEQQYKGNSNFQFLSINWDESRSRQAHVDAAKVQLKPYTEPMHLLFDATDGFRDSFGVSGPICYYLVDHRSQLLAQVRGDNPEVVEMDEHFENAVKNLDAYLKEKGAEAEAAQ